MSPLLSCAIAQPGKMGVSRPGRTPYRQLADGSQPTVISPPTWPSSRLGASWPEQSPPPYLIGTLLPCAITRPGQGLRHQMSDGRQLPGRGNAPFGAAQPLCKRVDDNWIKRRNAAPAGMHLDIVLTNHGAQYGFVKHQGDKEAETKMRWPERRASSSHLWGGEPDLV